MASLTLYANRRIRIIPNKCVFIRKTIEKGGTITVSKNVEIQPHDVIGKTIRSAGFASVNLAGKLGVSPKEGLKYLKRPIGKSIYAGELVAIKTGLFAKKVVTAPTDGLVDSYNDQTGILRLRYLPKEIPVPSGVFGIVEDINSQTGQVLIKTVVTQISGIMGSGNERSGYLNIIAEPSQMVNAQKITADQNGQILVAGSLIFGQTLKTAFGAGVKGIITGGLNLMDYRAMTGDINPAEHFKGDIGMSVMITEGFGPLPIGDDIFDTIKPYNGRFVIINGSNHMLLLPSNSADSILLARKTSLPFETTVQTEQELSLIEVKVGSKARIIRAPYMGAQGIIEGVDQTPSLLPSGIATYLVTLATKSQKLKVPYVNIEIIS